MLPNETKDDGEYKIYKYSYTRITSETKNLYIVTMSIDNYELKYLPFTLNSASSLPNSSFSRLSFGINNFINFNFKLTIEFIVYIFCFNKINKKHNSYIL